MLCCVCSGGAWCSTKRRCVVCSEFCVSAFNVWAFQMVFNVSSKAAVMASELWRVNGWYCYLLVIWFTWGVLLNQHWAAGVALALRCRRISGIYMAYWCSSTMTLLQTMLFFGQSWLSPTKRARLVFWVRCVDY